jgi:ubiquinone/menaquinone biosynthesis C-methylase UbiE
MKQEKKIVKEFYENYGWQRTEEGVYNDTAAFVDTRPVMRGYHQDSMARLSRYFQKNGQLFLDAGCGALASEEYLNIGASFQQRVCVDISVSALLEARKKLNKQDWFVVADICALPFREEIFDGVLCAHVLYHIPPEEQTLAVSELYRVLSPAGCGIVVYTWATCLMSRIAIAMNPRILLPKIPGMRWVWRTFFKKQATPQAGAPAAGEELPPLYFHPQNYDWYQLTLKKTLPVSLECWQSVSLPFSQAFIFNTLFSKVLLRIISGMDRLFPALMGKIGAYPLFIFRK